ncbi:MAG: arginine--tRNA ligase [Candidatus Bilamarchaeaceae archaeon]
MISEIKLQLASRLSKATGLTEEECLNSIEPAKPGYGDLSSNIAFKLSKEQKKNPKEIADGITANIGAVEGVKETKAIGPYINFYLSEEFLCAQVNGINKQKEKFGRGKKKNDKAVIEYPSVNPNKPWHIGHLRNALLGDSVGRILEFNGYPVERMDYIDDLGLQVAQSVWGEINLPGAGNTEGKKFDLYLGERYVQVAEALENDKKVEEGVRAIIKKLEERSDPGLVRVWENVVDSCVKAQYGTAFNYGIYHDVLVHESDISLSIFHDGLETLKKNKAIELEKSGKNAGCWVVRLGELFPGMTEPDKILIRSDGTATYTGKDVIFQMWKFGLLAKDLKFSEFMKQPNGAEAYKSSPTGKKMKFGKAGIVVNVIGMEQKYPQLAIKEVLRRLGYERESQRSIHLAYEHVWLPDVKFSGRKGTWIGYTADELLAEAEKRVMEKIKEKSEPSEMKDIARAVGVSAIKFAFLRTGSEKKITFNWDDVLSMEGDSGPYIQYSFVRINGILEKAGAGKIGSVEDYTFDEAEAKLVKKLAEFPSVVENATVNYAPHVVAAYLLELCASFNEFYAKCKVVGSEQEKERLAIISAVRFVLLNGMGLLGMVAPRKM